MSCFVSELSLKESELSLIKGGRTTSCVKHLQLIPSSQSSRLKIVSLPGHRVLPCHPRLLHRLCLVDGQPPPSLLGSPHGGEEEDVEDDQGDAGQELDEEAAEPPEGDEVGPGHPGHLGHHPGLHLVTYLVTQWEKWTRHTSLEPSSRVVVV